MKKIVSILLILLVVFSVVWAESSAKDSFLKDYEKYPQAYTGIGKSFKPVDAALEGRGGAGVALMDSTYAMFYNPAQLGENEFRLSLPSVGLTVYHPYALLKEDENGNSAFKTIMQNMNNLSAIVDPVLSVIGTQFAPLVTVDTAVGLTLPFGLGLGVYASDTVYTYDGTIIDEVDVSASLGIGYKIKLGSLSLSLGAAAKFNTLAFNERLAASSIIATKDMSKITVGVASGWAPMLDAGVTLDYENGANKFSAAVVMSDLNLMGEYKMDISSIAMSDISSAATDIMKLDRNGDLKIKGDVNLTAGIGYTLDLKLIKMKAALDLNDIIGLTKTNGDLNYRVLLKHVNAGLELSLIDMLTVRGGLNSGYYTLGASVDLYAIRIDAAYFWNEMGSYAGERGLDGLTIRFNLGYDR